MSENTKTRTEKCICKGCGANMYYEPSDGKLTCPYCGIKENIAAENAPLERDYATFLKSNEDWGNETRSFVCTGCGAETVFASRSIAQECPFCGASNITALEEQKGVRPDSVVPFKISKDKAQELYKKYIKGKFFAHKDFKAAKTIESIKGIYTPAWIFDCDCQSTYTAQGGEYYYETEYYTETVDGKSVQKSRQVRKTRWYPVSGDYARRFDNVNIPAGANNITDLIERVQPFDVDHMVAYSQQFLSGYGAEHYAVDLKSGFGVCKQKNDGVLRDEISKLILKRYDTVSDVTVQADYSNIQFNHTLIPVWLLSKKFKDKLYNFVVNGQTGKTWGVYPKSALKIFLTVLIMLGIAALAILLFIWFNN